MSAHLVGRRVLITLAVWFVPQVVFACDTCSTPFTPRGRATSGASSMTTPTGSTLGRGRSTVGLSFEHQRFHAMRARDAHALHHDDRHVHGKNHEESYQFGAGYGVSEALDLHVTVPIVSKASIQIEDHGALGRGERATGLGDVHVGAKYRVWSEGVDVALLGAVKAPTGETSERDQSENKIVPELQPGTGSWDVTTGVALSRRLSPRVSVAHAVQYTYKGEGAQDQKLGDVLRTDVGVSCALLPEGRYPNVVAALELQHQWAQRDRSRGHRNVLDSGGTTLLLSPGLMAQVTPTLSLYGAVPVPVYQNRGGEHEELKYGVITGVTWSF